MTGKGSARSPRSTSRKLGNERPGEARAEGVRAAFAPEINSFQKLSRTWGKRWSTIWKRRLATAWSFPRTLQIPASSGPVHMDVDSLMKLVNGEV